MTTDETYKPGDLAMVRRQGTHEEFAATCGYGLWFVGRTRAYYNSEVTVLHRLKAVPADAIVLDRDDEDVQAFVTPGLDGEEWDVAALAVVHKIRAQITPPTTEESSEAAVDSDGRVSITFRHTPKTWHELANILDSSVHPHIGATIREAVPPKTKGWLTRLGERVRAELKDERVTVNITSIDQTLALATWQERGWTWEADDA